MFVIQNDQVLLIRKKRGLGAGNINGPGGKIDPGESPLECAVRETREELCIDVKEVEFCGELRFHSDDFGKILGYVFIGRDFDGTPTETDEAIPLWTSIDQIPYHKMWDDDIYWLPHVLFGKKVNAKFVFSGETMLDYELHIDVINP